MTGGIIEKQMESANEAVLSSIEKDTIGEILNISMGAGATAISDLLSRRVDITTPVVEVIQSVDFEAKSLEPAVCIEIQYVEGLNSSNFMIMKQRDVRAMVSIILGSDADVDSGGELDEMHLSAIGEIMNQMMGSSCTALASFFGKSINISTPKTYELEDIQKRIRDLSFGERIVAVKFSLMVEGIIDSEFISVLPMDFTKEFVNFALNFDNAGPEDGGEEGAGSGMAQEQQKATVDEAPPVRQERKEPPRPEPREKPQVKVQPVKLANFDDDQRLVNIDSNQTSLDLLLEVPLEVTVEIGRTKRQVREILDIRQGSIIELDKQAGDPVDIFVNGQLIAKGDVVVIDDNFGVRITEIITNKEIVNRLN